MPLLTGDLQRTIFAAFRGKLLKGLIRQPSAASGVDADGDAVRGAPIDRTIEGFWDNYSDSAKLMGNIPPADVKVMIFGGSIPGIKPGKDDIVMLKGISGAVWYQLRGPVKVDPATALWECQAFEIKAPA